MKKILLTAAFVAAITLTANAEEYRHISPITIHLIEFNMDTMRNAHSGNLDMYLTQLASLQNDIEKQSKEIVEAQKNLKAEKKLYDVQMAFMKNRQAQVKNAKKFFQSEVKHYDDNLKNIKKQHEMIQKMTDVSSVAIKEQLSMLKKAEEDCNKGKKRANEMIENIVSHEEKDVDAAYETLSQYLIELNDKTTRLENLTTKNKSDLAMVKAQIKNIKDQQKAAMK